MSFYYFFVPFCSSHSCGSNAFNFVLNRALLTELFTIHYASRAPVSCHQNFPFLEYLVIAQKIHEIHKFKHNIFIS